jgi:hypothetical protein
VKAYGGVDIKTHFFLTSVLLGREWWASRYGRFIPVERISLPIGKEAGFAHYPVWTLWRKFLSLQRLELLPFVRPFRRQSSYRLSNPGSFCRHNIVLKKSIKFEVLAAVYMEHNFTEYNYGALESCSGSNNSIHNFRDWWCHLYGSCSSATNVQSVKFTNCVRFEPLAAVNKNIATFWNVVTCRLSGKNFSEDLST